MVKTAVLQTGLVTLTVHELFWFLLLTLVI